MAEEPDLRNPHSVGRTGVARGLSVAVRERSKIARPPTREVPVFVRIARLEGEPADADQAVAQVRERMKSDRPPGLEGLKRLLVLVDRESGRGLA
jgi:hypothetical protein